MFLHAFCSAPASNILHVTVRTSSPSERRQTSLFNLKYNNLNERSCLMILLVTMQQLFTYPFTHQYVPDLQCISSASLLGGIAFLHLFGRHHLLFGLLLDIQRSKVIYAYCREWVHDSIVIWRYSHAWQRCHNFLAFSHLQTWQLLRTCLAYEMPLVIPKPLSRFH
jgi:hypothetical protein